MGAGCAFKSKMSRFLAGVLRVPKRPFVAECIVGMLRFRFAVEDSWDMALFLAEDMALPVALLDRPWNRAPGALGTPSPLIERFSAWPEIVERFA